MDLEQKVSKYFPKDWKRSVQKVSGRPRARGRPSTRLAQGHTGPSTAPPAHGALELPLAGVGWGVGWPQAPQAARPGDSSSEATASGMSAKCAS